MGVEQFSIYSERQTMSDYLLAVLTEQADNIWYSPDRETATELELDWVERLWNRFPDGRYSVYGYVSF